MALHSKYGQICFMENVFLLFSRVEGDAHLADVTQGFAIVPLLLVERIQTTHSGAQVLGGHFSQPQSCCRLQASAMSKQHPFACIPKSRKTSCSLALLICPSILLVHIGLNIRLGVCIGMAKHRLTIRFGDQTRKGLLRGSIRSREGGQLVGRVQGRRTTTGGQGPGNADNWRAESRAGGQLAGKNRRQTKVGGRLAGRVQGRRTIGGQGPGKADNWWAPLTN